MLYAYFVLRVPGEGVSRHRRLMVAGCCFWVWQTNSETAINAQLAYYKQSLGYIYLHIKLQVNKYDVRIVRQTHWEVGLHLSLMVNVEHLLLKCMVYDFQDCKGSPRQRMNMPLDSDEID